MADDFQQVANNQAAKANALSNELHNKAMEKYPAAAKYIESKVAEAWKSGDVKRAEALNVMKESLGQVGEPNATSNGRYNGAASFNAIAENGLKPMMGADLARGDKGAIEAVKEIEKAKHDMEPEKHKEKHMAHNQEQNLGQLKAPHVAHNKPSQGHGAGIA